MKIAIISNLYPPYERGGAEIIAQRMANEYVQQGHEVIVITTHPWKETKSYIPKASVDHNGVKLYQYAVPNLYFYSDDYTYPKIIRLFWHAFDVMNIFSARTCKRILRKEQPDLVITHNLIGMGYLLPSVIRKQKIKHIHVLHDIQLAVRSGLLKLGQEQSLAIKGPHAKLYQFVVKKLFKSPDIVVSPSDYLRGFYTNLGYFKRSRFCTKRNPIPKHFFQQGGQTKVSDAVVFGYIGQLEPHKGLRELREAFSSIEDKKINLEIVGAGSLAEEVAYWGKEDQRVQVRGKVSNHLLPEWYQSIHSVIVPTLVYENSPTVVYEAIASGLPVIVSDIGGSAELVTGEGLGEKVAPGDAVALAAAILKVVNGIRSNQYSRKKIQASLKMLDVKSYCVELLKL